MTHTARCSEDSVLLCTDEMKVIYKEHTVVTRLLPNDKLSVTIDGKEQNEFPHREDWLALEFPDQDRVLTALPEIQLEAVYSKDNHGFTIRLPSHLFYDKTEGLCGKKCIL